MQSLLLEKNTWKIEKNNQIYWIDEWGQGYFSINHKGNVVINPQRKKEGIDVHEIVKNLVQRGIEAPILLRFDGIIQNRIQHLYEAFASAIKEFSYQNVYQLVYPIKVNQQKHVVETIRTKGREYDIGLEVGSKPELLAMMSLLDSNQAPLLCNGYKDKEYIELALWGKKLGKKVIIIIEQLYELDLICQVAEELNIEPEIGFRIKPYSKGSGKWASSSGRLAKFGLNTHEILKCVEKLLDNKKIHWVTLLHFHIGSQITSILPLKKALKEASRMYVELAKLCPHMQYFDVGGGLGVDYEGSKTTSDSSMNYSIEEYARDVVYTISHICREENIKEPIIITESGRALVAHHSVLITEVIDVSTHLDNLPMEEHFPVDHEIVKDLKQLFEEITLDNCLELYHDAHFLHETAMNQFTQGGLTLEQRASVEKTYQHVLKKISIISKKMDHIPEDIQKLDEKLLDIYFCNFSVFQSLPDFWAIDQLFPVMPIHRLDECPTEKAIIVDLSCDSDGAINKFVHPRKTKSYLSLHKTKKEPYYLGIFLVGAYQEILGGLHNLFGDTNVVHVDVDANGILQFNQEIEGDTINEVLSYVQYNQADLIERFRHSIEKALKSKKIENKDSAILKKLYKTALETYTYLVV